MIKSKNQLKEQLKETHNSKDMLLLEMASKTKQSMQIEDESNQLRTEFVEERNKVKNKNGIY